jgi:hypothetical protein
MIQHADEDDSINTYRNVYPGQNGANANECHYRMWLLNAKTQLNDATNNTVIQYNNGGVPDTTVVDLNDHTNVDSCKINFLGTQSIFEIRNNWSVPINIQVTKLFCRQSSGISPMTRWDTDMKAKGVTTPLTDTRFFIYDARQTFTEHWKVFSHRKAILLPGEEITLKISRGRFKYDPTEDYQYLKGITQALILRVQGVVAHDVTNTTDVGYQPVKYDYINHEIYRYTAELARNFKQIHPAADDSLPEATGGFITTNMDVEHNLLA